MPIRKLAFLVIGLSLSHAAWSAPALSVGKVTAKPGTEAILPISFEPGGSKVAAAQFSLTLPSGLSGVAVTIGPTGTAAGKIVTARQVGKNWNVIIMGMNQNIFEAGLLANATVKVSASAKPGSLRVPIIQTVYSDPSGRNVAAGTSKGGAITVSPPAP